MQMKAFSIVLLLLVASSIISNVSAESINDRSELLGNWKLNATARKIDGEQRQVDQSWEFHKDGTLVSTASYESGVGTIYATKIDEFSVTVKYEIKDGKIVSGVPGRQGKTLTYQLIERNGKDMILRQGAGEFMFFTKQ